MIKADFWIDGYDPTNEYNSNTTSELFFDEKQMHFYLDVFDDETEKCITRIYLDDILHALSDIIR